MSDAQKPSVGRIVHYRLNSGHVRPAIITSVREPGVVDLHVFDSRGPLVVGVENVSQSLVELNPTGTWRWPPRV
jgi:hypothetical protein